MNLIRLGKTQMMVSEIGFGGIPIIPLQMDDAVDLIRHCYQSGINFFDTANMYADSEKKIGAALESVRDQVYLATKTLERKETEAAQHILLSLENLRTDYIDLFQFHNISRPEELEEITAPDGAYKAAEEARKAGKIRFIGFSSHDSAVAEKACRTGLFQTLQFPFNMIEHQPAEQLFQTATELDMGIIAMKPLGGGLLDRADLCFRFLQQYPHVLPIPGFAAKEEIDEIIRLYEHPQPMSDQDRAEIERFRSKLGNRFCHRCGYCMPCQQEIKIPLVLMVKSHLARKLSKPIVQLLASENMKSVDSCTECGECMERCPYQLPIPELLKESQELYKRYVEED